MMKYLICIVILLFFSCNKHKKEDIKANENLISTDTIQTAKPINTSKKTTEKYSNNRFREVMAEKVAPNKYRIQGEAQIFEANFSWVIEDGHNELKKGFEMTDAGAPQWGKFDFTIDILKERENSTLIIILFEISAKDGSRQYELPIPLK